MVLWKVDILNQKIVIIVIALITIISIGEIVFFILNNDKRYLLIQMIRNILKCMLIYLNQENMNFIH